MAPREAPLTRRKLRLADALGSRALRADAMEGIACGWLSFVVVVGLLVQLALGAWWVDAVTSLALVWLLVKEGREAVGRGRRPPTPFRPSLTVRRVDRFPSEVVEMPVRRIDRFADCMRPRLRTTTPKKHLRAVEINIRYGTH